MVAPNIKVLVAEENGSELVEPTERRLVAEDVFLSAVGITADNVKGGIEEVNLTANTPNFSYREINKNIIVPIDQQMVVFQQFCVNLGFEFEIQGEVAIIE